MANDPSMPPSEQNPGVPVDNSPAMSSPDMAAPAGDGGDVMISMPRAAFTAIHTLVTQLAQGLDQLEQTVAQQEGKGGPAGAPTAAPAAPAGAPAGGEPDSNEAFLKSLAEEGSKR